MINQRMNSTCTTGWEAMFCWKISNRSSRFSSSSPLHPDILFMIILSYYHIKLRSDKHICLRESSNRVKISIWIQCVYSPCTTRVAVVPDFSIRDSHAHSPVSYCHVLSTCSIGNRGGSGSVSPRLSSLFCLLVRIRDYDVTVEKIPYRILNFLHIHRFLCAFCADTATIDMILGFAGRYVCLGDW